MMILIYRRLHGIIRDNRGQTIVEFALAAVIFFSLLFLVMDLGLMFYANFTMQHAVREGTRYAITGRIDAAPNQRAAVINTIKNKSNGLCDDNRCNDIKFYRVAVNNHIVSESVINSTSLPTNDPIGSGGQIIVVRLTYDWPLLTPFLKPFFTDGKYSFIVSSAMRNEVQ
jgi:Flp pilus assembly protein TadG